MPKEKYSITWQTYSDHLKSMMTELMMSEDFSDVTLVTEDKKQIKANINILSACSSIFRDTLKKEKNLTTIMYLRGIQYSEIESILQYIYLGEATLYEERMDEFLAVAKSLEIKGLFNIETETNVEPEDGPSTTDSGTSREQENSKEQTIVTDQFMNEEQERRIYGCEPCQKSFAGASGLSYHNKSVHQSVKYACDQCDSQFTQQCNLTSHIQSKHEGVKHVCVQCGSQFTEQSNLNRHIQSKHEGIKYVCDQCEYQATDRANMKRHIGSKHEGVKYACNKCGYQATQQVHLNRHIQSKHEFLQFA